MKSIATIGYLWVLLAYGASQLQAAFVHPGILNSQAELTRMQQMVAGGVSPWLGAFKVLAANGYSQSTYTASPVSQEIGGSTNQGNYAMRDDATAAYQNALMWCITGNQAYATCAINIIDAWTSTLTSFDSTDDITAYDVTLKFTAAAEILTYESGSGWTAAETTNLTHMLVSLVSPALINSSYTKLVATDGNQGIGCMRGIMALAIYTNNTTLYNVAVNLYEGTGSSIDSCVAVTYYIDSQGCSGESGRDQAHPQGGLASYAEACKMAEIQGLDLWGYAGNRLMLGFEYIAEDNLGDTVSWTNHGTCNSTYYSLSTTDQGYFNMMYDMAYNHYVVTKGLSMPYSTQVLERIRPETGVIDDPGFGTLLYSVDSVAPPSYDGTYKITNVNSGLAIGTVGGRTGQTTGIEQRTYSGITSQQWVFLPYGNEYYQFYPKAGTSANIFDSGSSPSRSGVDVHLWANGAGANQIWKITPNADDVQFISRDTILMDLPVINLLWTITDSSTTSGALVEMDASDGGDDQEFDLTPIYPRIEASSYDTQSGTQLEDSSEGGEDVCFINNGDWTEYNSLNVAGATSIDLRVACPYAAGGTIEVHEGSTTGTLLGTATVHYTSAWQTYGTISCPISGASGTQDIYLVFKGGSGSLFNVLWFTFK